MNAESQEEKEERWNSNLMDNLELEQLEREEAAESGAWDGNLKNEGWTHQSERIEAEKREKERQERNEPGMLKLTISGARIMKIFRGFKNLFKKEKPKKREEIIKSIKEAKKKLR